MSDGEVYCKFTRKQLWVATRFADHMMCYHVVMLERDGIKIVLQAGGFARIKSLKKYCLKSVEGETMKSHWIERVAMRRCVDLVRTLLHE